MTSTSAPVSASLSVSSTLISAQNSFDIIEPDDFHVHLRDGDYLPNTVKQVSNSFRRALVMPNLKPPLTNAQSVVEYRDRINKCLPSSSSSSSSSFSSSSSSSSSSSASLSSSCSLFTPLMSLYLHDGTSISDIDDAHKEGVLAVKLYPKGATTHSAAGVTLSALSSLAPVFRRLASLSMLLLIHGESTDDDVDIFDREVHFLKNYLPIIRAATEDSLKIVIEHVTTAEGASLIASFPSHIRGTVTPQHLLYSRNALLSGGLRPHLYCMPLLKTEQDRKALVRAVVDAATGKFFAGTDSAPHPSHAKESCCGSAGCYSAHAAVELYTSVFEDAGATVEQLQAFLSQNGADFYGLKRNTGFVRLVRRPWRVPSFYPLSSVESRDIVVPLKAGEEIQWTMLRHRGEDSKRGDGGEDLKEEKKQKEKAFTLFDDIDNENTPTGFGAANHHRSSITILASPEPSPASSPRHTEQ